MTADIIDCIAQRLSGGGYKVSREVVLPYGPVASVAASRTHCSWKGLVVLRQSIIVRQLDNARVQDVQELSEAGFRLGYPNWAPLLKCVQLMIVPIIVGAYPDSALVEYVSSGPWKKWPDLFEYPVLVDSRNCRTLYFQDKAFWGASDMQRVVEQYIASSLPSKTNTASC